MSKAINSSRGLNSKLLASGLPQIIPVTLVKSFYCIKYSLLWNFLTKVTISHVRLFMVISPVTISADSALCLMLFWGQFMGL